MDWSWAQFGHTDVVAMKSYLEYLTFNLVFVGSNPAGPIN